MGLESNSSIRKINQPLQSRMGQTQSTLMSCRFPYLTPMGVVWGRTILPTKPKVKVINNIHQHIRVVHLLDQVGLDFDVISVVLDKYRDRLSGLPKPLPNILSFETLKNRRYTLGVGSVWGWGDGRSLSINRVFEQIYHSNLSPFVSGDLETPYRTIPRGFKGSVMENWCLIDRLNNTRMFKSFQGDWSLSKDKNLCRSDRTGRTKPFNYKLMDKELPRDCGLPDRHLWGGVHCWGN